jgi:hypothetical protein
MRSVLSLSALLFLVDCITFLGSRACEPASPPASPAGASTIVRAFCDLCRFSSPANELHWSEVYWRAFHRLYTYHSRACSVTLYGVTPSVSPDKKEQQLVI